MRYRICQGLLLLLSMAGSVTASPPESTGSQIPFKPPEAAHKESAHEHPEAEPFTANPHPEAEESHSEIKSEEEVDCHKFWITGEYLLWRIRDSNPPLLVTMGQPTGPTPGAVGNTGTTPLFGGGNVENNWRSGARLTAGSWLDEFNQYGVEGSYFFLGSRNVNYTHGGDGGSLSPVIARPFFNAITGQNDASLVSYPGLIGGTIHLNSSSQMQGAEINGIYSVYSTHAFHLDGLLGVRYLYLKELLDVTENDQILNTSPVMPGTRIAIKDHFGGSNNFYGGQVGLRASMQRDSWELDLTGKIALGIMDESVDISGVTAITPSAGTSQVMPGGFLAVPSNMGHFLRDVFTVVPEANLQFRYHITSWMDATLGYTILYVGSTVRPGDQVDTTINPTQVPTSLYSGAVINPVRPLFLFHGTDFYAQGFNMGLTFRY